MAIFMAGLFRLTFTYSNQWVSAAGFQVPEREHFQYHNPWKNTAFSNRAQQLSLNDVQ
jgi:hypothetical protein